MKKNTLVKIVYILIAIFILLIVYFGTPFQQKRVLFPLVAVLGLLFLILGIVLLVLTLKSKIKGKLKLFLILTGASAILPLPAAILHNVVYGLMVLFGSTAQDEAFFFILALIVAPILFLIGAIGSIILTRKRKKK